MRIVRNDVVIVEAEKTSNGVKSTVLVLSVSGGHVEAMNGLSEVLLSPETSQDIEDSFAEAGLIAQRQRDKYDEERRQ